MVHRTTLALFAAGVLLVLAAPAHAQLSLFEWDIMGSKQGGGYVVGDKLFVQGPDGFLFCSDEITWFETTAPTDGTARAWVWFTSYDDFCSPEPPDPDVIEARGPPPESGTWDLPVYMINGQRTDITYSCFGTFMDYVQFDVEAGDRFGYGVFSRDCAYGGGLMELTDFTFTAATWSDVGGAIDPRLLWTTAASSDAGTSVAGLGDTNGDGVLDVAVGSPGESVARLRDGATGAVLATLGAGAGFGNAVSGLGDVDGDGYADVAVGQDAYQTSAGRVVVVSGRWGTWIETYAGSSPGQLLGRALAGPGDVDGDGVPDLLVGSPGTPESVKLYSGPDLVYDFGASNENYGETLAAAGDVDADGVPDLLIGAPFGGRAEVRSGADGTVLLALSADDLPPSVSSLKFGTSVTGAGDVDGDGFADVAVGDPLARLDGLQLGAAFLFSGDDGAPLGTSWGETPFTDFGETLSGGLDANGDAVPDLLVGAPKALGTLDDATGAAFLLSTDTGALLHRFEGLTTSDDTGSSLALVGDVTGDGLPDALVGSPGAGRTELFCSLDRTVGRPVLSGTGTMQSGTPFGIDVTDALPGSTVFLVLGLSELAAPFLGGVLVPSPDAILVTASDGDGSVAVGGTWPVGVPAFTSLWLQAWIVDAQGPQGFAATNGLLTVTSP